MPRWCGRFKFYAVFRTLFYYFGRQHFHSVHRRIDDAVTAGFRLVQRCGEFFVFSACFCRLRDETHKAELVFNRLLCKITENFIKQSVFGFNFVIYHTLAEFYLRQNGSEHVFVFRRIFDHFSKMLHFAHFTDAVTDIVDNFFDNEIVGRQSTHPLWHIHDDFFNRKFFG